MEYYGIRSKMSTSRHPQTDGFTNIMNLIVENYLRCYCSYHQMDRDVLLTTGKFAYNSSTLVSHGKSPFELDIGWCPSSPLDFLSERSDSSVQSVADLSARLKASFEDALFAQLGSASTSSGLKIHKILTPILHRRRLCLP